MVSLADTASGAPSLMRATAGFVGSTILMASLMVLLSAVSG
jgi:hypothetical protein